MNDIFNCEMYLCENRITHNVTLEESCDGGVFNGPYAAALKRDLLVCYDCDDQLTMTPPPDRRQWVRNSAKSLETVDERIARIEREQCFYPFANCDTKAETKAKDPIGSDPMQYCKKHDAAMRQRYAKEAN